MRGLHSWRYAAPFIDYSTIEGSDYCPAPLTHLPSTIPDIDLAPPRQSAAWLIVRATQS